MMKLHRALLSQATEQAWRNAGGSTRELLAWPQVQAWQLRVSVARIDRDGPFSAYSGTDRWFAVLEGAGVRLRLPAEDLLLTAATVPVGFAGEAAPGCTLIDGPTSDLNLMMRRGLGEARMWRAQAEPTIAGATRWRGVYAQDACTVRIGKQVATLGAGTLLWSDGAEATAWSVESAGRALCLVVR
jgi:hypothetical protein